MNNSNDTIYFNFSYFALNLLGKGLYSNAWTAIAELVANGLDAGASTVKIYINMVNKENAVIEIFDNGCGMDYKDLAEKYTLIGRNKREDIITEEIKQELMGRKGIGKLAALYLSNKYYLISKTNAGESAWCLDASDVRDSDVPHLDRVSINDINIESIKAWNKFSTGTMIKLTNVNLTHIGIQTIAGFKSRLANFYLLNALKGQIKVAVVITNKQEIVFEKVEKVIAFKNMYAFYNNTDIDFSNRLSNDVFIKSKVEEIKNKRREVEVIDPEEFCIKGKRRFLKANGQLTDREIEYEMKGWIGIHTSLSKEDTILNDPHFTKNRAYTPNQLRLYVRKKLAIENFMDYIKSNQAFANYIEGEISFDILDEDELGDIATSNRQGFIEDDERIVLLNKILNPIINKLIRSRAKIGKKIGEEEDAYYEKIEKLKELERLEEEKRRKEAERLKRVEEKRREEAERARIWEEKRRKEAEHLKVLEEKRREEAEKLKVLEEKRREEAEKLQILEEKRRKEAEQLKMLEAEKRKEAEMRARTLDNELKIVSTDLGSEKKRNYFLVNSLDHNQIDFAKRLHTLKINLSILESVIKKLLMKLQRGKFSEKDAWDSLKTISYISKRMAAILEYGGVAKFNTAEETTFGNLFQFIKEYNENILVKHQDIKISVDIRDNTECVLNFSAQDIALMLENIISNSIKNHASNLYINMYKKQDKYHIEFVDDGVGLDNKIRNVQELFEFGKGYTSTGTGVGLYHIREIVEERMKGKVEIVPNIEKGFKILIRI